MSIRVKNSKGKKSFLIYYLFILKILLLLYARTCLLTPHYSFYIEYMNSMIAYQ